MPVIRTATPEDAPRILDIYAPFVEETPITFETEVPTLSEFQNRMKEILKAYPWLVFEAENQIAGYAYAGPHRTRSAYAWSLESTVYVDTNFQKKGVGKALYKKLIELLREQGALNIIGGITIPNASSIAHHESLGLTKIAQFMDVGFKLGKWWDVGFWQMQIQKPREPGKLKTPQTVHISI